MRLLVCALFAAALAGPAAAEVLTLPDDSTVAAIRSQLPARGSSMRSVEARLGMPMQKHAPVGGGHPKRPPITRWDYPGYSVFFENDHVIDAVIKGAPAPLHNVDALRATQP
ncbi:hypothetical protein JN531_001885 [Flagellatimonas centrodinii]|uniref:hypothetical protein n=1 Tax=Flagellatimonas centrodinii TaxID=2806210 RepID=UPI001FEE9F2C|nr:hypothetical protein [Flagellatimonas centrodinii]ULQ47046.1 hypothetical protein JN531_001885 [Flagellatimonas centrodinii]